MIRRDRWEEAQRWFEQARWDVSAARRVREAELYSLACFVSQQAAEKALKAYLFCQGLEVIREHSVGRLAKRAAAYDPEFAEVKVWAALLDKYYIPTRYPNGLASGGIPAEAYDDHDAARAVELAEKLVGVVGAKMSGLASAVEPELGGRAVE